MTWSDSSWRFACGDVFCLNHPLGPPFSYSILIISVDLDKMKYGGHLNDSIHSLTTCSDFLITMQREVKIERTHGTWDGSIKELKTIQWKDSNFSDFMWRMELSDFMWRMELPTESTATIPFTIPPKKRKKSQMITLCHLLDWYMVALR